MLQAIDMVKEMMAQYNEGKTTSLKMNYTATGENAGIITFDHVGFVPHMSGSANIADQKYNTVLTWNATSGVIVTVNGTSYTDGTSGAEVKKTDEIKVTNATGSPVIFTLTDNAKYLKAGSILGDRLTCGTNGYQKIILGHAKFVTLKCSMTTDGGLSEVTFTNAYEVPKGDVTFRINKTCITTPRKAHTSLTSQ